MEEALTYMRNSAVSENMAKALIIAAAIIWGTTGTAQELAPSGADPLTVGAMRMTVGGIALLLFGATKGLGKIPLKKIFRLPVIMAALCISSCQLFFFAAVQSAGVAVGTVVGMGSAPILAGILGYVFRREEVGMGWVISTFMAVLGCGFLAATKDFNAFNLFGLLLALGAGASYAGYQVANKVLLEDCYPQEIIAVIFCLGSLMLSPILIIYDISWVFTLRGGAVALHLGVVTVGIAFFLFSLGLSSTSVANAATLSLAEPLTAAALGLLFIRESLSLWGIIGLMLMFIGLAVLSCTPSQKGKKIQSNSSECLRTVSGRQ